MANSTHEQVTFRVVIRDKITNPDEYAHLVRKMLKRDLSLSEESIEVSVVEKDETIGILTKRKTVLIKLDDKTFTTIQIKPVPNGIRYSLDVGPHGLLAKTLTMSDDLDLTTAFSEALKDEEFRETVVEALAMVRTAFVKPYGVRLSEPYEVRLHKEQQFEQVCADNKREIASKLSSIKLEPIPSQIHWPWKALQD